MKNATLSNWLVVCLMILLNFGFSQSDYIGRWTTSTVGYSISNREDTAGEAVVLDFNCENDQLGSRFLGFEYLMFEDPSTVEVLYRTDSSGVETLQVEPNDGGDIWEVADANVSALMNHLSSARELTVQVTAGGYEYTHNFDVSEFLVAVATLSCRWNYP